MTGSCKIAQILMSAALVPLLLLVGWLAYWVWLGKQVSAQGQLIQAASDRTFMFRGLRSTGPYEAIVFDVPTPRDIQLRCWANCLFGKISTSVVTSDGKAVFQAPCQPTGEPCSIHVEQGRYRVLAYPAKAFCIGGAIGVNFLTDYVSRIPTLADMDLDGLPDELEHKARTDIHRADTDGDSLSDYEEAIKYGTNPGAADSDGDGIPDGDWNERREYAYTAHVLMRIREPFDIEAMNDLYQDARIVADPDPAGYSTIEAAIYPQTCALVTASHYPLRALPPELHRYTQSWIATNFDADMQAQVRDIVAMADTDVQAVARILDWVRKNTTCRLNYSIPEVYFTYVDADGQVQVRDYHDSLPAEELLRTHYFAASMFQERTHGTCTSIATLKCAMIRAAGIPCRLIQTVFPIYYHADQTEPYANNLRRPWECAYEYAAGENFEWVSHAFLEVYLGQRWIRVDEDLGVYQQPMHCLSIKILSVADWSEVDFSKAWPTNWIHERPYYTLTIDDQEPQHQQAAKQLRAGD